MYILIIIYECPYDWVRKHGIFEAPSSFIEVESLFWDYKFTAIEDWLLFKN